MPKTVAVIDGNSLMHRAYHAVPPTMTAPDGTPTNAAFGFLSMLLKFIEMEQPDALVCAFDKGRPKFRMEALEQYKATPYGRRAEGPVSRYRKPISCHERAGCGASWLGG